MTISLQLAFYAGIVLAFPFLIYFAGSFVLPALTPQEKRAMLPAVLFGFGLFLGGVTFSYFFVLPPTLRFFFHDAMAMHWTPTWNVREYFSFVTQCCVGFGVAFELPVIVLVLVRLGLISTGLLRRTRAYALVLIFCAAVFLAPTPDIVSMLIMGAPMYVLYEICIFISGFIEKKRKRDEQAALATKA
jgi:sec-independent protein translocase protein TatC